MKKDLDYYKNNAEEDYMTTPISVLRCISELENTIEKIATKVLDDSGVMNFIDVEKDIS
jgi:hypothetical protein